MLGSDSGVQRHIVPLLKQYMPNSNDTSLKRSSKSAFNNSGPPILEGPGLEVYFICRKGIKSQLAARLVLNFLDTERAKALHGQSVTQIDVKGRFFLS